MRFRSVIFVSSAVRCNCSQHSTCSTPMTHAFRRQSDRQKKRTSTKEKKGSPAPIKTKQTRNCFYPYIVVVVAAAAAAAADDDDDDDDDDTDSLTRIHFDSWMVKAAPLQVAKLPVESCTVCMDNRNVLLTDFTVLQ